MSWIILNRLRGREWHLKAIVTVYKSAVIIYSFFPLHQELLVSSYIIFDSIF